MDPGADDAEDTDELFVRPVVRIPAPLPAEAAASNFEISGKRQRSQVPPPPPPPTAHCAASELRAPRRRMSLGPSMARATAVRAQRAV